jgi:hypothetical protein
MMTNGTTLLHLNLKCCENTVMMAMYVRNMHQKIDVTGNKVAFEAELLMYG